MKLGDKLADFSYKNNNKKIATYEWQDYAASVMKEFNIDKRFYSRFFKMAKTQRAYFEAKVGNMRELKIMRPYLWESLKKHNKIGNYFLATFRKK